MNLLQAIFLGTLQGLTEFIPVSSSGHLVIAETFFNLGTAEKTLQAFDIALHAGTLLALIIYFYKDFLRIFTKEKNILLMLIIATIPISIIGVFFDVYVRDTYITVLMMAVTAGIMFLAENFPKNKNETNITWRRSIIIGCMQSFALMPGISRAGITISTGMFQRLKRETSARFSFLLATPAILGAVIYITLKIFKKEIILPDANILIAGIISSFITSYLTIKYLLLFLKKHSLKIFSYYLFAVAIIFLLFNLFIAS